MTDTGHRLLLLAFALVAAAGCAIARPADLLQTGEYLARAGDCVACHSAPGGKPFAGGLKMAIPFIGVIYTTNITPDKKTGIGNYTFEDFVRAMRRGIARDGHRLYPAMPYPSYAKVADDDLRALYAFFMHAVPAVERANQPAEVGFPLNMRWPLAIWDGLFVPAPGFKRDGQRGGAWNRGAYLVQGLGHCGACHTPRGFLSQEKGLTESASTFLSGAQLDQWSASNLRGDVLTGLGRWSEAELVAFLQTGHNNHSTAFGTMIEVINNSTQHLTAADLWAIAKYLQSLAPADPTAQAPYIYEGSTAEVLRGRVPVSRGARIYLRQCAACHLADGRGYAPYLPPLSGNPAVLDSSPASLINITLNGSVRVVVNGLPDAYRMPQSRLLSSDQDVADVVTFIRTGWGNKASAVTAGEVAKIRASTSPASDAVVILKMK